MTPMDLQPGDVVQLSPNLQNKMFAACLLIVTEPKSFGCQGYVQSLGKNEEVGGQAYLRPKWEDMEYVGKAVWMTK